MPRWLALCVAAPLAGCYVYQPASPVVPDVGTHVAAQLTGAASDTLTQVLGPNVIALRGSIVGASDSGVVLAVTSVRDRTGRDQSWEGEHVRLPRAAVQGYERRHFSLGRSLVLGIALGASSVMSWEAFQGGIRGGGVLPGGGSGAPK